MTRSPCACSRNDQVCALGCWVQGRSGWWGRRAWGVLGERGGNRNFAIVSGPMDAKASATAAVSGVAAMLRNEIASLLSISPLTIVAACSGLIAVSAGANAFRVDT